MTADTISDDDKRLARDAWEAEFSTGAKILDGIYAVYAAGLAAGRSTVPDGEVAAVKSIARQWRNRCKRYERIGSDWHNKMPGDWPVDGLELTVAECRECAAKARGS